MTFGAGAYNILQMLNLLLSKWDTLSESIVTRIDRQSHAALIKLSSDKSYSNLKQTENINYGQCV
jgi:hypothetical protein